MKFTCKQVLVVGVVLFYTLSIFSCKQQPLTLLFFQPPAHFPEPLYMNEKNPVSQRGFELGRRLFYDPVLSRDSTISCGSCHHLQYAFSDAGNSLSVGVDDNIGMRNTPGLFNLAWHPSFMHDGGVNHLEVVPIAPITDPFEMDENLSSAIEKLNRNNHYPRLFKDVFKEETITDKQLLLALAQFMTAIVSASSRYDDMLNGRIKFSNAEQKGYKLFRKHCASCHKEPLLSDFSFRKNGLAYKSDDEGRSRITQNPSDKGKFKVPSLRNVELTAPYMHDGSIETLEEVIYKYSVPDSAGTKDPLLADGFAFDSTDVRHLIAFLKTLTDHKFINNRSLMKP